MALPSGLSFNPSSTCQWDRSSSESYLKPCIPFPILMAATLCNIWLNFLTRVCLQSTKQGHMICSCKLYISVLGFSAFEFSFLCACAHVCMLMCVCVFLCICIYLHSPFLGVCLCKCVYACVWVCVSSSIILYLIIFFWDRVSHQTWNFSICGACLASDQPFFISPGLGLIACSVTPGFSYVFWEWNWVPHTFSASILLAEPSPQLFFPFLG